MTGYDTWLAGEDPGNPFWDNSDVLPFDDDSASEDDWDEWVDEPF